MPLRLSLLLLVLALPLAACDRDAEGTDAALDDAVAADAPAAPDEAAAPDATAPDATALGGAACLVGTWAMDAAHSFRPEMWANMAPNGEVAFELGGTSGRALLTFTADGSAQQRFEDFSLTLTGDTSAGEMSTTVRYDGTASGRYTAEGDRLRMTPGEADLTSRVQASLGGREISNAEVDVESLFEDGERSLMTFTCRGDELLFDVHETAEGGRVIFDEARFTRVGG